MITKLELDKIIDAIYSPSALNRDEYDEFIALLSESRAFYAAAKAVLRASTTASALGGVLKVADGLAAFEAMFYLGFKVAEFHLKKSEIGFGEQGKGGIQ